MSEIPDVLSAAAAGVLLRERREERGLTQDQLAEAIGTDKSYISKLEGGVYNVGRSKYFPAVAKVLKLTEFDIRSINPAAVFSAPLSEDSQSLSAAALGYRIPKQRVHIPDSLTEAGELYGQLPGFSGLAEYRWQHYMASLPRKITPSSPEGWMKEFTELKSMNIDPPEPDE